MLYTGGRKETEHQREKRQNITHQQQRQQNGRKDPVLLAEEENCTNLPEEAAKHQIKNYLD